MCFTNSRAILVLSLTVGLLVVGTLPERAGAATTPLQSGEPAIFVPKAAEGSREPSRRWEVHLVHGSHHDLGYTDLPSNVLREHDGHLDKVLDFCDETADWPEESRFRYVAEQAWSVLHYLEHRPAEKTQRLLRLMREGRIEVTATLGNQVCGLCSHEELIRLLYPSFRLKRRFGVPITSAELNDIPGFSWGLASVLSGSGVRYFAPGIQDYFAWGRKVRPNWDEQAVIARDMLGAFWWEGPDGSRVLLWYGGPAIEGPHLWTYDQARRDLAKYLAGLQIGRASCRERVSNCV